MVAKPPGSREALKPPGWSEVTICCGAESVDVSPEATTGRAAALAANTADKAQAAQPPIIDRLMNRLPKFDDKMDRGKRLSTGVPFRGGLNP